LQIQPITAEETYELRHQILRPNQPVEECAFALDRAPGSLHIGCFLDGKLVGVGTIFREGRDASTHGNVWRIRGMAVLAEVRGMGAGGRILQALIDHATSHGLPGEIWCNGRANVRGYYERYGFVQQGDIFDTPYTGPHALMVRALQAEEAS